MSEAELHWLRQRLQGGKLTKAEQGKLRFRLPVGLVYDPADHIVLDPDEAVQEAFRLVFTLGSVSFAKSRICGLSPTFDEKLNKTAGDKLEG